MINHTANLYGWARNVYKFGCSFIHLSVFHYYSQQDPFNRLSKQELEIIKEFMMQYHNFPKNRDITFDTLQPYLLNIFEKINSNLKCSLENLAKNPIDTYVL